MTNNWEQRIAGDVKAMGGSIYSLKRWHEIQRDFWKDQYENDKDEPSKERAKSRIDFENKYLEELNKYESKRQNTIKE